MNWYKKAQKIPTMENIIWAIDKLIAENYDFSVEELMQASQGQGEQQYALPKAAETNVERNRRKYKKKYRRGVGQKSEKDVLNTVEEFSQKMQKDFNIKTINATDIANVLDLSVRFVKITLRKNNIESLRYLTVERRDRIAQLIGEIAKDLNYNFTDKQMAVKFKQKHNFQLTPSTINRAVKLNNLKKKDDPNSIFKSFTTYIDSMMRGGRMTLIRKDQQEPGTLALYIDQFFRQYGEQHGFIPPYEQEMLKKMFLTKLQIRDNTMKMERNKYTPVDYSENNPATFTQDREQNELV